MGKICVPLLSGLKVFLHSYEVDVKADLIKKEKYRLVRSFDLSFRHIYDVLPLNYPNLSLDQNGFLGTFSTLHSHMVIVYPLLSHLMGNEEGHKTQGFCIH